MFVNLLKVRIYDNTAKNPVLAKDTAKICLVLQMNREFWMHFIHLYVSRTDL